jgi:hypothetical protein
MTKNGRPFDLPILDFHHEIIEPMRGLSREWVFPVPRSRAGHLECPKRLDWSPHAHRRTFATVAMEAGVLEEIRMPGVHCRELSIRSIRANHLRIFPIFIPIY